MGWLSRVLPFTIEIHYKYKTKHPAKDLPPGVTSVQEAQPSLDATQPSAGFHQLPARPLSRERPTQPQAETNSEALCTVCRGLHLTKEFLDHRFDDDYKASSKGGKTSSFEILIEPLRESSLRCEACAILMAAAKAFSDHMLGSEIDGTIDHEPKTIKYPLYRSSTVEQLYVYFPLIPEGPDGQTLGVAFNRDYNNRYQLYTMRERPIARFNTIGRQAELPIDATESIPTLKKWMHECISSHPDCGSEKLPLPTRVIDVGPDGNRNVRLHISHGETKSYAALSHCWGKKPVVVTELSNIEQYKREIPWESLSQTFKDAVICTQKLGLRYLWIDSLCIIQGSFEDWARESGMMGSIYRGAEIVLGATAAAEGDQGLLNKRRWFHPARTVYVGKDEKGTEYQIRMRREVSNRRQHYLWCNSDRARTSVDCKLAPLTKRAWAFQEQWLARRYVHFKQEEMIYECQSSSRCECLYVQDSRHNTPKDSISFRQTVRKKGIAAAYQFWQQLAREYALRQLTYSSDFLPAMSGLAQEMQAAGAGEYLCGLWRSKLMDQLLWRVSATRAVPYRAPTWSWASVNFEQQCSLFWLDVGSYDKVVASIVDVKCNPKTSDLTGAVEDGYLLMKGPLLRVVDTKEIPQRSGGKYRPYLITNRLQREPVTDLSKEPITEIPIQSLPIISDDKFCFQTDFKISDPDDLFFLLVRLAHDNTPEGIVLRKTSSVMPHDIYERVGAFMWAIDVTSLESDGEQVDIKGKGGVFNEVPQITVKIV